MLRDLLLLVNENIWEIFAPKLTKRFFEVFRRAGSDWPMCEISTLSDNLFMFFVYEFHISCQTFDGILQCRLTLTKKLYLRLRKTISLVSVLTL